MKRIPSKYNHFVHIDPYYKGNSLRGVRKAAKRRGSARAIDLDFHVTKDGVWVNTHWGQPLLYGFRDPLGKIKKTAHIADLTWAQVKRLEAGSRKHPYRIQRAEAILALAARLGVRVEIEVKSDRAFNRPEAWATFAAIPAVQALNKRGLLMVKTLDNIGAPYKRLRQAHAHGFTTLILVRRGIPADKKNVDYITYWR
jgi:glycerophosphoryl diester phosphodiesterase